MPRTTIRLTTEQYRGVRELAREMGVSMFEVVRRSVDHFVQSSDRATETDIRRRAKESAGTLCGGPADLASRHDHYLAEDFGQ